MDCTSNFAKNPDTGEDFRKENGDLPYNIKEAQLTGPKRKKSWAKIKLNWN